MFFLQGWIAPFRSLLNDLKDNLPHAGRDVFPAAILSQYFGSIGRFGVSSALNLTFMRRRIKEKEHGKCPLEGRRLLC